jgi:hypothetical protein
MAQNRGMDLDLDRLADLLAARLAAIVPDGVGVLAADGMLWYSSDPQRLAGLAGGMAGTYVRDNFDGRGDTALERLAGTATQALDDLQDYVDEASGEPWPGTHIPPRPFAQVRGQMLHLWYGGPEMSDPVVLACEPIPLGQIRR